MYDDFTKCKLYPYLNSELRYYLTQFFIDPQAFLRLNNYNYSTVGKRIRTKITRFYGLDMTLKFKFASQHSHASFRIYNVLEQIHSCITTGELLNAPDIKILNERVFNYIVEHKMYEIPNHNRAIKIPKPVKIKEQPLIQLGSSIFS